MAWPNQQDLNTEQLDAGSDNPGLARSALLATVQKLREIISARGEVGGICELDDNGKVPDGRIDKAAAGGVCELDANGKVPTERYDSGTAGTGLSENGGVISHGNTSSQAPVSIASNERISEINVDQYGHVSSIDKTTMLDSVTDIRLGPESTSNSVPSGAVVTGINVSSSTTRPSPGFSGITVTVVNRVTLKWRIMQKKVNGNWVNVTSA